MSKLQIKTFKMEEKDLYVPLPAEIKDDKDLVQVCIITFIRASLYKPKYRVSKKSRPLSEVLFLQQKSTCNAKLRTYLEREYL